MGRGRWQRLLRAWYGRFTLRAILLWLAVLSPTMSWQCTQSAVLSRRVDLFVSSQWGAFPPPEVQTARLSFSEAFQLAVRQDERIQQILGEADSTSLDIDQAESELWPRFDIQATGEIPIGGDSNSDDDKVRGGLFMRYDLQKALFRSDAAAAARAARRKQIEQAKGLMMDLAYDLFAQLARIGQLQKEVRLRQTMADQAKQGALTAQKMYDLHLAEPPLAWQWQSMAQTHRRQLNKARSELAKARRALGFMLGMSNGQSVEITDFNDIAATLDRPPPLAPDNPGFLQGVWQRRADSRMAEMDLFLAELALLQAKRKRLPRLSGSIGVGSFDLRTYERKEAPVVVELTVNMPVFDWGDIGRSIKKAELRREWAQRHIRLLIHRLLHNIRESTRDLQDSDEAWQQNRNAWQAMQIQAEANQRLLDLKMIQPLDALKFQLETGVAEIDFHRSRMNLMQARASLQRDLGFDLVDNLPPHMSNALPKKSASDDNSSNAP